VTSGTTAVRRPKKAQEPAPARPSPARPLRADAKRNIEKVLKAAEEVFAKEGLNVPVDQVASRAGVGIGTIYRHFPTKQALVEAIVAARLQELVERARELRRAPDPAEALFAYLGELVAVGVAKRDFMEELALAGMHSERLRGAKAVIDRALSALLRRAQAAGMVRKDLTTADLSSLVMGLCAAACERRSPDAVRRLLSFLRDGLSPPLGTD
jgi:AcrR family transcriptional regulator